MKRLIILLTIAGCSLVVNAESEKEIETDFKAWTRYALLFTGADEAAGDLWDIVHIDGRKFTAEKRGRDFFINLQFASFTIPGNEVVKAQKNINPALKFKNLIRGLTAIGSQREIERLKKTFPTDRKINEAFNWWLLYLSPEDKNIQDKLKQLKSCLNCKSTGKVKDHSTAAAGKNCIKCKGKEHVDCKTCSGSGEVNCRTCGGIGTKTEYETSYISLNAGNRMTLKTPKEVKCVHCLGSGKLTCRACTGKGEIRCKSCKNRAKPVKWVTCPACRGARKFLRVPAKIKFPFPTVRQFKKKAAARQPQKKQPPTAAITESHPAPTGKQADLQGKLEKLESFYNDGILTEAEFRKAEKRLKLKILLDEGILSQAEFDQKMKGIQVLEDKAKKD
jgi:hypothetical protein